MKALFVENRRISLRDDLPMPVAAQDEALIRPLLAGLCNTDSELVAGYYDFEGVPGHEFVGRVVDGPPEWVGKRVVGDINVTCGECDMCRCGVPTQCRTRTTLGIKAVSGVFADYFALPVRNLHAVPLSLSDEQAVFTEPLAAACSVLELVHVRPTDRVILIGAGKLGMLTAQVLRLTGTDLTVVVRHDKQADLLAKWGIPARRRHELEPAQADIVVDCTGNATGFADALSLLKPRGQLVLKSTFEGLPQVDLSQVAVAELKIIGSRCGPFEAALRLLEAGLVEVTSLIDARFCLEEGVQAFEVAALPGMLKVLLTFDLV